MLANPFNQIKSSVLSSFYSTIPRSSEPINIPIITNPYTGKMSVFDGSKRIFRTFAKSRTPAIKANLSPNSSSSSSLDNSEQASPLLETSSSNDSFSTAPLSPNLRLFRGSQDEFGFDVYITVNREHSCEPAYLFECPVVLPWDQLVVALAEVSGRRKKDLVLSSNFYPCVVADNVSYQAWLAWSRESDGPCSTDLWLTS